MKFITKSNRCCCIMPFILAVPALLWFFSSNVQAGTSPDDLKWLATKKLEAGVVETASGLLYKGTLIKKSTLFFFWLITFQLSVESKKTCYMISVILQNLLLLLCHKTSIDSSQTLTPFFLDFWRFSGCKSLSVLFFVSSGKTTFLIHAYRLFGCFTTVCLPKNNDFMKQN